MSINQPSLDETGAVTHLLRGRSDAGCPPGSAPLCKRTATSPGRGQDPQRAPRDTHPAPQRLSPAHVFLSSQLTLSQERGEQRQLYITMCSASAHTPVLPSHPSCRDLGGGKAMPRPSPHDCIDTSTERAGAPRALCGEGGGEEALPPSPHNEPIVGGAGGGVGRVGQATEASSRGSRRRCQGLLLQGTLRLRPYGCSV